MNKWKIGNKVWTWSFTGYGSYMPSFSEYEITGMIVNYCVSFVYLESYNQADMVMPIDCVYSSKSEAIEGLIAMLEDLKCDHEWSVDDIMAQLIKTPNASLQVLCKACGEACREPFRVNWVKK